MNLFEKVEYYPIMNVTNSQGKEGFSTILVFRFHGKVSIWYTMEIQCSM
jgi:hypothetical protein